MPRLLSTALLCSGLALNACNSGSENAGTIAANQDDRAVPVAEAKLLDASEGEIGTVRLTEESDALSITVSIEGLEPGERAFHLHTTGVCEGPDFKTAGGHLNPFKRTHGSQSVDGAHLGDLPNLLIEEQSSLETSFQLPGSAEELLPLIFDADGTAVMLHAGPDDYMSDPAGAAGPRIACGVLVKK